MPYGFGYTIKGSKIGLGKVQGHNPELDRITTKNPTENFLDPTIFQETATLEMEHCPYDIFVMPWALADNALIDADLPDAVKLWNEKYAYPKVIIAGSKRIKADYEKRYGNIIPDIQGDYTEYWTDGLGSDARRIGLYRKGKENLVQAQTAWSMLNYNKPAPHKGIDTTWENSLLGAEHTWGYQNPKAPLAKQIEQTKASFFENTFKGSEDLLKQTFGSIEKPASSKIAVFNTLSWARDGLITLSKAQSMAGDSVLDSKGKEIPSQRLNNGELVFMAKNVPALGAATYLITSGKPTVNGNCKVAGNVISNEHIAVTIDSKTGDIISLIDKRTGHDYVNKDAAYHLNSYRYLTGTDSADKAQPDKHVKLTVTENGPLVAIIKVSSDAPGCNWLTREVRLVAGQPWVDITNTFDKISTLTKVSILVLHLTFRMVLRAWIYPGA